MCSVGLEPTFGLGYSLRFPFAFFCALCGPFCFTLSQVPSPVPTSARLEWADEFLSTRHHPGSRRHAVADRAGHRARRRSEEHTSELQSLMRISYAVFCLKKK